MKWGIEWSAPGWTDCDPGSNEIRQEDVVCVFETTEHRQRMSQKTTADVQHTAYVRRGGRKNRIRTKNKGRFNTKRTHTTLTCKASISALILSCSLSYEALSGLPVPYSMSVIVEAVEVVVVVVVVSVKAGASYALPDVVFGFLFCESLVEAVLVFVEAAMNEEIEDGGRTRGGRRAVIYGDLIRSRLRRGGI